MNPPAAAQPLFGKIALIGIGLIGGSIALAARRGGLAGTIVAATRSAETAATANRLKLVDHCGTDLAAACVDADLVIVCTPVGACGEAARLIAPSLKPGCIVSDVGSVKQSVIDAMQPHLPAGVVVVILPGHLMTGGGKQPTDGVSQHRLTAVPDAERSGGVGADKLHQHPLTGPDLTQTKGLILAADLGQHRLPDLGSNEEVDKARPGDLDLGKQRAAGQEFDQVGRHGPGVALLPASHHQGEIGGQVPLPLPFGLFQGVSASGVGRPKPPRDPLLKTGIDNLFQTCTDHRKKDKG